MFLVALLFLKLGMRDKTVKVFYIFSIICLLFYVSVIICFIVFLKGIQNNDLFYDCSDDITNEFLKQENNNTKKSITIVVVNLVLDVVAIILFLIMYLYILKNNKCSFINYKYNENNNIGIINTNSNLKPNNQNVEQINKEVLIK